MPRLEMPPADAMSPEQAEVCAEAMAGPRGKVPAPMIAWVRNPELARRGQKVGELLRFGTTLEPRLSELAILMCGRHWTSHHEWTAHKAIALSAGLAPETIAAIAARRVPQLPDERHRAVHEVSRMLLARGRVPDAVYAHGVEHLGERGMVELVGILGYYCWVSLTLNAFELGLPAAVAPELQDPDFPQIA
ncbi:MAG: 4-carboxymuconolactone decarboxylase [Ramlibacter sp.]|jgi:4-carboxymuconolactone decarboxylase|uniref:carboxymuconolactone decarboxylase family protein n=1 Tax=Ramlibacter sp. TaxID=1917967 RepID=UPI00262E484E|nr:carboxymuconolactone decarboxylase family protein [Ramlibacter sp.]MDB5750843.1 4-carboxymuconolactone decarboxylase [Ramlibacter sp.]